MQEDAQSLVGGDCCLSLSVFLSLSLLAVFVCTRPACCHKARALFDVSCLPFR